MGRYNINLKNLQIVQHNPLTIATGCVKMTSIDHTQNASDQTAKHFIDQAIPGDIPPCYHVNYDTGRCQTHQAKYHNASQAYFHSLLTVRSLFHFPYSMCEYG